MKKEVQKHSENHKEKGAAQQRPEALRLRALARWDNEGGAEPPPLEAATGEDPTTAAPAPTVSDTATECQHLHSRLIALENLVISVLALGNKQQLVLARDMASHISARAGTAPHRLTQQAATQMAHLVGRAQWFRDDLSASARKKESKT